jgi:hypothetical protein
MAYKATGKPNGKPPFKPTDDDRKTVELMCSVGIPHEGIALCIRDGIDDKTLRKYFRKELDTAAIVAHAKVGGTIFNAAIKGQAWACSLYARTKMGWKETSVSELVGKDGNDIGVTVKHDLSKLDIGQLKALELIIKAAEAE